MQGVVKSDGMDKTVVVTVQRLVKHPRVKKYIRRNSRFMAHDAHNEARVGDTVEIEETGTGLPILLTGCSPLRFKAFCSHFARTLPVNRARCFTHNAGRRLAPWRGPLG